MNKSILFVSNSLSVGGVERALILTANSLADVSDITILLHYPSAMDKELDSRIKIIYLGNNDSWVTQYRLLQLAPKFFRKKLGLEPQYDVEIVFRYDLIGNNARLINGRQNITFVHGDMYCQDDAKEYHKSKDGKKLLRREMKLLAKCNRIVCVSNNSKEGFIGYYGEKFLQKTVVLPNAVDVDNIDQKKLDKIAEVLPIATTNLVTVSRLDKKKNVIDLLRTKQILDQKGVDVSLTVVGDGETRQELQDFVKENNMNKVCFVGNVDNPYKYINACDIFVFASIEEAFGIVAAEAMALKKPVISYCNRGIEGLCRGYAVLTDFCPKSLAEVIEAQINAPNIDVDNAYNYILNFDIKRYREKLLNVVSL